MGTLHCEPGHWPGQWWDKLLKLQTNWLECDAERIAAAAVRGWPLQLVKLYHFIFYSSV